MEIFVRPADRQDAVKLMGLLFQLQDESSTFMLEQDPETIEAADEADNIDILQTTTNNIMLVAVTDEGQLVGLASATAKPKQPRVAEVGVAVLNEYQGNGLAQAMMAEILDWATTFSSVNQLVLTVQTINEVAIHIYEKLGFKRISESESEVLNSNHDLVLAFDMSWIVND
ncbi:GNAT family N-acetyltransferase [Weissella thailandensis]|uniref:GNAT family N-acetyltransferase n=1 Tax=Weissella thailandensis TaxID=89061 RepID=A0ABX9I2D3_9LACO|nr:GNAT family N-acetyltransferase [Weissella thailandensis]NKY91638.1 GNAT family N-acetyltransferase [Weissella thailandensis]RDS58861.1 GNAT family N-acetyltransferase [Weissella thailandensis]GEP75324.1 N-acetyltransferase [Weissella thailandensis]